MAVEWVGAMVAMMIAGITRPKKNAITTDQKVRSSNLFGRTAESPQTY